MVEPEDLPLFLDDPRAAVERESLVAATIAEGEVFRHLVPHMRLTWADAGNEDKLKRAEALYARCEAWCNRASALLHALRDLPEVERPTKLIAELDLAVHSGKFLLKLSPRESLDRSICEHRNPVAGMPIEEVRRELRRRRSA
jgi:hypothetical protein